MTGKKIIEIAIKYLGDNGRRFCQAYGLPWGAHWCCVFVWYVFMKARASVLFYSGQKTAYVPTAQAWLETHCRHVSMRDARAGDMVIFTWHGGGYNKQVGSRDHIGFIRKAGTSQTAYTIEGNTGGSGPRTSKVMLRTRSVRYIFGIYRPKYEQVKKSAPKKVVKKASVKTTEHRKTYIVVSPNGMNVRKSYTTSSNRISGIPKGKSFKTTRKHGNWVYSPDLDGWVCIKGSKGTYLKKLS